MARKVSKNDTYFEFSDKLVFEELSEYQKTKKIELELLNQVLANEEQDLTKLKTNWEEIFQEIELIRFHIRLQK